MLIEQILLSTTTVLGICLCVPLSSGSYAQQSGSHVPIFQRNRTSISIYQLYDVTENIKENIQTSAKESLDVHELKQNKAWFDEECLGFCNQRKRAKMQWIQDPSQSNVDILNNVRREVSRHFRDKT